MSSRLRFRNIVISVGLILLSGFQTTFAAVFSDVSIASKNYTAIQYLAQKNIISGYPDGTFQPDKAVSRVEFLKLVLLSSNIQLDVQTNTGFTDINENAWYAPYLR